MGPGFVILFWLFVAGVFGLVWVVSMVLFIMGRRKRSALLRWLGGVPLFGLTLLGCVVAGVVAYDVIRSRDPRVVYQDTFHEKPSADVVGIQSAAWAFADSGYVYLRFRASESTFRRIRPTEVPKVTYAQYQQQMPGIMGVTPPTWWSAPTERTSEIYLLNGGGGKGSRFAGETTLVTYDAETGTVEYFYLGID